MSRILERLLVIATLGVAAGAAMLAAGATSLVAEHRSGI
jgi:hypothetical protein